MLFLLSPPLRADTAQQLFSTYADRLYQIKVVEKLSKRKSGIGSGFLVSADGLIVTNYHVISKFVHEPDKYYLEAISINNEAEPVTVEDFDVINDLALIKITSKNKPYLKINTEIMRKGDPIYSMGNPFDLGVAVVPGTYNGFTKQSYYQRIHFTGSINPGMSGGPVLNSHGKVVGVNVATAGNSVGFLVIADKLLKLLDSYQARTNKKIDFQQHIQQQLVKNQKFLMDTVLAADWKTSSLGDANVLNEIVPFIPCWGDKKRTETKNEKYFSVSVICRQKEIIYLKQSFRTGVIDVQYNWVENISLSALQFTTLLEKFYREAYASNSAQELDVTEFACYEGFVARPDERAVFCSRAYKKYKGLYDIVYMSSTVEYANKGLVSQFTLSGVEKPLAMQFLKKFLESRKWN